LSLAALAAALPWLLAPIALAVVIRLPRTLPALARGYEGAESGPLVSVVIPARNEARNIETVLRSVTATEGVAFEVIVVDDRSDDGTADLAGRVSPGRARRLNVLSGDPLPDGWFGKPWACHQGAAEARGEVLLFTDADTVHGPGLMARALAGLDEDRADALTVIGRQLMGTFWERLVQPQVFMGMLLRYPRQTEPLPAERWRDAIANGQYIVIRSDVYDAMGGHETVRGEVVEDMKLAQALVRAGRRLSVRRAEDAFATRMYRSLGELVEGWSKNLLLGGLETLPPGWLRAVAPALAIAAGVAAWLVPVTVMVAAWLGLVGEAALLWSQLVVGMSIVFWAAISVRFGASPFYGLGYPLGAAVVFWILVRAWVRGRRVRWKGREYVISGSPGVGRQQAPGA
jgi:chlorobactene glucosyltransferase